MERARYVSRMFSRIAVNYDRMNSVMSAGRHHAWRRTAVSMAKGPDEGPALDVATGTGDFAIELAKREWVTNVVAADFSREMLITAHEKSRNQKLLNKIYYTMADAHSLPFSDNEFVCATVGFGIRNFVNVATALSEMTRVVKPGGRVVVLEIIRADDSKIGRIFPFYFGLVTPWLGSFLAGNREAYDYLPKSVETFLTNDQISSLMARAGLCNITVKKVAIGTVSIHSGEVE